MSEDDEKKEVPKPGEEYRDGETGRFLLGRPGPGRPRGSPNKSTIAMRTAIAAVFEDLQASVEGDGRYPHFLAWAKENPTEFYRIAARQLPLQIEATSKSVALVVFKGLND